MNFLETLVQGVGAGGYGIFQIIAIPFQIILNFFSSLLGNSYAASILVFTVIINFALFPLNIKQQKTLANQQKLKPKLDKLKEKCGNDRMKYQTAMTELYQKEGVSPTGGCAPMLIRMLLLMGIYEAVRIMVNHVKDVNMDLFGLDLTKTPSFSTDIINNFKPLWIIPILSFATAFLSSIVSMKMTSKSNPAAAGGGMKGMMLFMPLISLFIAFGVPGAVGFYWVCSNVVNCVIQVIVTLLYSPDKLIAMEIAEHGKERRLKEKKLLAGKE